jgi:hypothetical protein
VITKIIDYPQNCVEIGWVMKIVPQSRQSNGFVDDGKCRGN